MDTPWSVRRPVRDLRPGDHAWLAFVNDDERRHVTGSFVRAGLRAHDKVVLLGDPEVTGDLESTGEPIIAGRVTVLTPGEICPPGHPDGPRPALAALVEEIERAERAGHRGIRVSADWTWALRLPGGVQALLDCERRFEAVVSPSTSVIAVCQVDRRACDPGTLAVLAEAHGVAATADPEFADSVLRIDPMFQPAGLVLSGELDASRHAVFSEALSTVLSRANGDPVHLDLAALDFIDLTALSMLVAAALRRAGRGPVVLDRIPHQLRAVLAAIGWDMLPGLELGSNPP